MNKILSIAIACMVLFIFIRCTDKEEAPLPTPHLPTAEEIFIEKINKIKELIDSAGTLPTEETTPMKRELVSRKDNDVVYRYDEETEDYGYYTPVNFTFSQKAFEKVAELPPMKSVDVIWPGNLIQGKSVADGNLAAIPVADKRAGGEIVLNVVSGQEDMMYYRHVENMSGAGVTQAMNDMLAPYESGFPADVSYLQSSVSSIEEMSYYLDMRPEELNEKSNGAFKPVNWTTYTNKVMIKLRQVFFTISYDYRGIENVFSQNIEYNDLKAYITENNPPCYIASVSYGRYFILLYESEYSENKLYDVLRKAYSTENLEDFTPQEKKIIHKSKVYMVQVGGNPVAGLETITTDPDKIREFVIGGAVFSKDNVGAPISYKVCYLQNAVPLITYKKLDVVTEKLTYIPEKKTNNVTIEIKDIFSDKLNLTGGNMQLSNHSWVTVGDIAVNVYNRDGSLFKRLPPLKTGIVRVPTKENATYRKYDHRISTGELGENTDKRVAIEFTVHYYIERYGGGTSADQRIYRKRLEFAFDDKTQTWKISDKDIYQKDSFTLMNLRDYFNFCYIDFQLGFRFSANRETYKQ